MKPENFSILNSDNFNSNKKRLAGFYFPKAFKIKKAPGFPCSL